MKKYVYSKGAEAVTVETDGLATINNFDGDWTHW